MLLGLKAAALAGKPYGGKQRSQGFPVAEREVIRAFCEYAWQIGVNREAWKLSDPSYSVRRIRTGAFSRGNADLGSIGVAVRKLRAIIDVRDFDAMTMRSYTRACFR